MRMEMATATATANAVSQTNISIGQAHGPPLASAVAAEKEHAK